MNTEGTMRNQMVESEESKKRNELTGHIARVCHEANRAWCETHGDTSQKPWDQAEDWQAQSAFDGVAFRLDNPNATDDAQHNAWMQDKINNGWVYGEVKDAEKKTHPCIVPFNELSEFQQKKDRLFCAIVDALKPLSENAKSTPIRDYTLEARKHFDISDDQLTPGEEAVGLSFNPSNDDEVAQCKRTYANAIDQMNLLREKSPSAHTKRHASVAITDAETAQMRAVKAITWRK